MPDGNGNYDGRERMADHERINRNIEGLHASMTAQKENIDKLLVALRELIDRIPPENLRP
jgi:hypothetical protein